MDVIQYPTVGRLIPEPTLGGELSQIDSLNGRLSSGGGTGGCEVTFLEVDNDFGTGCYIVLEEL